MIILDNQMYGRRHCSVVLVLQHDQAFWVRVQDGSIVDSYTEVIEGDVTVSGSRCPWVSANSEEELVVRLVLDSSLDELDRVAVNQTSSDAINKWRRFRTLGRLKNDYSQSSVFALDESYAPHVGSVLHHVMAPMWNQWLEKIQCQGVIVTAVSNSIELLSHWSSRNTSPLLLVQSNGADQRQILVDSGSPVFTRHVDTVYARSCESVEHDELTQSIDYLKLHVFPNEKSLEVGTLFSNTTARSEQWSHVHLLVDLLLGHEVALTKHSSDTRRAPEAIDQRADKLLNEHTEQEHCLRRTYRIFTGALRSLGRTVPCEWRVENRDWHGLDSLAKSSKHWLSCNRLNRLRYASMVCATAGILTVVAASIHGVASARMRTSQLQDQNAIQQLLESREKQLFESHSNPYQVAYSNRILQEHQQVNTIEAKQLLPTIARAMTDVPGIVLDRLVWSTIKEQESSESLHATSMVQSSRDAYWSEDDAHSVMLVSLSGVVEGANLGHQKETLDAFVSALLGSPRIGSVQVLESPVDAALNNGFSREAGSQFRVNLITSES